MEFSTCAIISPCIKVLHFGAFQILDVQIKHACPPCTEGMQYCTDEGRLQLCCSKEESRTEARDWSRKRLGGGSEQAL